MNKTTRTIAASTAFLLGTAGFAGVALANEPAEEGQDVSIETERLQVQTQLEDGDDAANDDGERNGRRGNRGNRGNRGQRLSLAADTIGIEVDELREGLQADQSLAEIAEENGVAPQAVIDAMVDAIEEKLDAKVEAGDITEEEAAEKLESKTERIENKVNGVKTERNNDAEAEETTA